MTLLSRLYKTLFNNQAVCRKANGYALFNEAAKEKPNVKKMLRLIEQGADVNVRNADQATVLIYVAGRNAFSNDDAYTLALRLLEAGAKINDATSCGNTALIWSARAKRDTLTAYLIEHGADIHAQNDKGETVANVTEALRLTPYELKKTMAVLAKNTSPPPPLSA